MLFQVKMKLAMRESTKKKGLGSLLILGSLAVTILLVLKGGSHNPLPALDSWLLGVMAAILQIAAGVQFASVGRADPALAKSSVRYLVSLGDRAQKARLLAEQSFESGTSATRYQVLGQLSVYLSEIEEGASLAAQSWADFHPDAVADMIKNARKLEGGDNA
jgi:hypothetical protein